MNACLWAMLISLSDRDVGAPIRCDRACFMYMDTHSTLFSVSQVAISPEEEEELDMVDWWVNLQASFEEEEGDHLIALAMRYACNLSANTRNPYHTLVVHLDPPSPPPCQLPHVFSITHADSPIKGVFMKSNNLRSKQD